jgi:F0F1-type ATP synthase alpha subunit
VQDGTDVPRHNCDDRLVHAEPISTVILEMIGSFPAAADIAEVGHVISVGDGIARGLLDKYAVADILSYETELYGFLEMKHPVILATLANTKQIDESLTAALDGALNQFAAVFKTTPPLAAAA